jgi:glycosidase
LVKAFELDYSWPLHNALTETLQGRRPASELRAAWKEEVDKWPRGALHMRFSDNHDERRSIARFGEKAALAASAFMITLDGVPLLYNGMEVGDTTESGAPALFEKLPIFWPIVERRKEFPRFYQRMLSLRRESEALRRGSLEWVRNSDESRIVTFVRRGKTEDMLIAINFSNMPFAGTVEATHAAEFTEVTPEISSDKNVAQAKKLALPVLALDAHGFRIFRRALVDK